MPDLVLCVRIRSYSIEMLSTSAALVIVKSQIHNLNKLSQTPIPVFSFKGSWMLIGRSDACSVVSETGDLKITTLLQQMIEEEQLDIYCI